MIAIIGATSDDILYFKNKMVIEKEEKLFKDTSVYVGTIVGKEICVVATGLSMELSAIASALTIEKYNPYLVYNIGTVHSIDKRLKQGDIFLAERIYLGDVDLSPYGRISYGQIQGLPPFFLPESSIIAKLEAAAATLTSRYLIRGYLFSNNRFFTKEKEISPILNSYFAGSTNLLATDNESGGVAIACYLKEVPYVCIKSVSYEMDNDIQLINHIRKGLEAQPAIGKIISSLILATKEN